MTTERAPKHGVAAPIRRVVLAGYIGFGNCGDEAMLAGAIRWLRREFGEAAITVLSVDPARTAAEHGVAARRALPVGRGLWLKVLVRPARWKTLADLRRADLVVWVAGSGIFSDARGSTIGAFWPLYRLLRALARRFIFLSASAGPVEFDESIALIRRIVATADAVCLRDPDSAELLRSLVGDGGKVVAMADLALELEPAAAPRLDALGREAGLVEDGNYLACCPIYFFQTPEQVPRAAEYREQFIGAMAAALDELAERDGLTPVFVPFQRDYDTQISRAIAGRMRARSVLLREGLTPGEMIGLLGRMRVVIGVRLHSLILAAMARTPCVAIVYDEKSRAFLRDLGLERLSVDYYCWQKEHPPLDVARLVGLVRQALEEGETLRARVDERLDEMRQRNHAGRQSLRELGIG